MRSLSVISWPIGCQNGWEAEPSKVLPVLVYRASGHSPHWALGHVAFDGFNPEDGAGVVGLERWRVLALEQSMPIDFVKERLVFHLGSFVFSQAL